MSVCVFVVDCHGTEIDDWTDKQQWNYYVFHAVCQLGTLETGVFCMDPTLALRCCHIQPQALTLASALVVDDNSDVIETRRVSSLLFSS